MKFVSKTIAACVSAAVTTKVAAHIRNIDASSGEKKNYVDNIAIQCINSDIHQVGANGLNEHITRCTIVITNATVPTAQHTDVHIEDTDYSYISELPLVGQDGGFFIDC